MHQHTHSNRKGGNFSLDANAIHTLPSLRDQSSAIGLSPALNTFVSPSTQIPNGILGTVTIACKKSSSFLRRSSIVLLANLSHGFPMEREGRLFTAEPISRASCFRYALHKQTSTRHNSHSTRSATTQRILPCPLVPERAVALGAMQNLGVGHCDLQIVLGMNVPTVFYSPIAHDSDVKNRCSSVCTKTPIRNLTLNPVR